MKVHFLGPKHKVLAYIIESRNKESITNNQTQYNIYFINNNLSTDVVAHLWHRFIKYINWIKNCLSCESTISFCKLWTGLLLNHLRKFKCAFLSHVNAKILYLHYKINMWILIAVTLKEISGVISGRGLEAGGAGAATGSGGAALLSSSSLYRNEELQHRTVCSLCWFSNIHFTITYKMMHHTWTQCYHKLLIWIRISVGRVFI